MKALFIPFRETFETEDQRRTIEFSASSRLRCDWIAKYWDEAEVLPKGTGTKEFPHSDFDIFIFQKAFSPRLIEFAHWLKQRNKKVIFDLCDAEWVYPSRQENLQTMITLADQVTVSTFYIQEYIRKNYNKRAQLILDRLDLDEFPTVKEHKDTKTPKVVWFGNRNTIAYIELFKEALLEAHKQTPFELLVISDKFDLFHDIDGIKSEKRVWNIESADKDIMDGDVVINPHDLTNDIGKAKSDNKTIHSWALGMPVVSHGNNHRMASLLTAYLKSSILRNEVGRIGRKQVERFYDVRLSAIEFNQISKNLIYGIK